MDLADGSWPRCPDSGWGRREASENQCLWTSTRNETSPLFPMCDGVLQCLVKGGLISFNVSPARTLTKWDLAFLRLHALLPDQSQTAPHSLELRRCGWFGWGDGLRSKAHWREVVTKPKPALAKNVLLRRVAVNPLRLQQCRGRPLVDLPLNSFLGRRNRPELPMRSHVASPSAPEWIWAQNLCTMVEQESTNKTTRNVMTHTPEQVWNAQQGHEWLWCDTAPKTKRDQCAIERELYGTSSRKWHNGTMQDDMSMLIWIKCLNEAW